MNPCKANSMVKWNCLKCLFNELIEYWVWYWFHPLDHDCTACTVHPLDHDSDCTACTQNVKEELEAPHNYIPLSVSGQDKGTSPYGHPRYTRHHQRLKSMMMKVIALSLLGRTLLMLGKFFRCKAGLNNSVDQPVFFCLRCCQRMRAKSTRATKNDAWFFEIKTGIHNILFEDSYSWDS